jgi:two-component system, NarL family, response regulator LiaR
VEKIRVFCATCDAIFQQGLCQFVEQEGDLECIARPTNGEDTIKLVEEMLPDVVILDLDIPLHSSTTDVGHAAEVARRIKEVHPSVAILMVSTYDYQRSLFVSFEAGAAGYLLKKTAPRELISAVRSLCSGEAVFDLEAVNKLIGGLVTNRGIKTKSAAQLRPSEVTVLKVAAKGVTNKEIASELSISERTVQTHLVNIFRKLECNSRTQAVLHALREGWLELEDLP